MANTFDYRLEAERCLEAAEKTASPEGRKFLLAMARVWTNMAGHDRAAESPPAIRRPDAAGARDGRPLS